MQQTYFEKNPDPHRGFFIPGNWISTFEGAQYTGDDLNLLAMRPSFHFHITADEVNFTTTPKHFTTKIKSCKALCLHSDCICDLVFMLPNHLSLIL